MNSHEQRMVGDVFQAPIDASMQVEDGGAPPMYGDILDLDPASLSVGDLYALEAMGDVYEVGALQVPTAGAANPKPQVFAGKPMVITNPQLGAPKPRPAPRTVNAQVALGRATSRMRLAGAGIATPGGQQSAMATAEMVARFNRLGKQSLGILGPNDYLPFSYAEKGRLHALSNIREGAAATAATVKIAMQQQLAIPYLPYRRWSASVIPAVGGTVNLTSVLPVSLTDQYGFFFFVVRLSSTMLNSNPSKLLTVQLTEGTGGAVSRSYQKHEVSYDSDGVVELVIMPGFEVQGNYWPRMLVGQNTGVPATVRDVNFTVTGNDGTSDNLTVFGIGPDDWYWKKMMARLSA